MSKHKVIYSTLLSVVLLSVTNWLLANDLTTTKSSRRTYQAGQDPIVTESQGVPPTLSNRTVRGASRIRITSSRVKKASHFDTTGKSSSRRKNAAQRLRAVRNSKVDEDLKAPIRTANVDPKKNRVSSKRQLPVESEKNTSKDARDEDKLENELAFPSKEKSLAIESPSTDNQLDQPESEDALEIPEYSNEPQLDESDDVSPNEISDDNFEPELVPVYEPQAADDEDEVDSPDALQEPDSLENAIPSVVSKSTIRHQIASGGTDGSTESSGMRLSPISVSGDQPQTVQPAEQENPLPVNAEPVFQSPISEVNETPEEDLLFHNESPLISVKTRGPRTIVVGKPANYLIDVENASSSDAKDVVINIRIPTWTEVSRQRATTGSARTQPDDKGNTIMQWVVGQLDAHGKQKLILSLIPRSSRPFDLGVSWTFNPVRSSAHIQVQEPKLELAVMGPQDVQFGETKVYSIIVSNPGTGDAENVVLQLLPLIPTENSGGVRQLGNIKAGTRRTVEVELTARQSGRLQIRAEATADGGLFSKNQQEVLVRRAAIEVKLDGPPMKYANTRARYSINVTNSGDATARDVVAVVTLPSGATNIATNGNGTVHAQHGQVKWDLGLLRPGAVRRMEVDCLLTEAGANRVDLRSVAHGNISAVDSVETNVESLADLKLVVNDPKGAVAVGTDVAYDVLIMNRGTKEAKNVKVVGYFSEGVEPTTIDGWAGRVTEGQIQLDNIPRLGPGQEMAIEITAKADRAGNHVFRAELMCNNPETRLAQEEWTRFYGERVSAAKNVAKKETRVRRTK